MIYYLVVVTPNGKKKVRMRIPKEMDETKIASELIKRLKERGIKSYFVYGYAGGPPSGEKPPKKDLLWCPYCRDWRKFKKVSDGYEVCSICGVSTKDFYIMEYNNRWPSRGGRK